MNDAATPTESETAMSSMTDLFGPVIHSYTRQQAIADGVLIDVTDTAAEAGFTWPVAMTVEAWRDMVQWNDEIEKRKTEFSGQDERGRLWDVLYMAHAAIRAGGGGRDLIYSLYRVDPEGRGTKARKVQLRLIAGPGDDMEPVLTIMLPHQS